MSDLKICQNQKLNKRGYSVVHFCYIRNLKLQKLPKTTKILKNGQHSNLKLVLESVLVTDSKNSFRFLFFLPEVPFFGYSKCQKKNTTFGTKKIILLAKKLKSETIFGISDQI